MSMIQAQIIVTGGLLFCLPVFLYAIFFLKGDVVIFRTKSNKIQLNLFNWSKPSWANKEKLQNHFKYFGPILIVSNKLYVKNVCGRGCCNSVEIRE